MIESRRYWRILKASRPPTNDEWGVWRSVLDAEWDGVSMSHPVLMEIRTPLIRFDEEVRFFESIVLSNMVAKAKDENGEEINLDIEAAYYYLVENKSREKRVIVVDENQSYDIPIVRNKDRRVFDKITELSRMLGNSNNESDEEVAILIDEENEEISEEIQKELGRDWIMRRVVERVQEGEDVANVVYSLCGRFDQAIEW